MAPYLALTFFSLKINEDRDNGKSHKYSRLVLVFDQNPLGPLEDPAEFPLWRRRFSCSICGKLSPIFAFFHAASPSTNLAFAMPDTSFFTLLIGDADRTQKRA